MKYETKTVRCNEPGLTQEQALASLYSHYGDDIRVTSVKRRGDAWVVTLLQKVAEFPPKKDEGESEAPEPKSEEPTEDPEDGGSEGGPADLPIDPDGGLMATTLRRRRTRRPRSCTSSTRSPRRSASAAAYTTSSRPRAITPARFPPVRTLALIWPWWPGHRWPRPRRSQEADQAASGRGSPQPDSDRRSGVRLDQEGDHHCGVRQGRPQGVLRATAALSLSPRSRATRSSR
jgi:hypothetical protein